MTKLDALRTRLARIGRESEEPEASDQQGSAKRPVMGVAADTVLVLKRDLYQHGYDRAMDLGDVREDSEVLKALQHHAEAMALDQVGLPFDPSTSAHDQTLQQGYERAREQLVHHTEKKALAQEEVRKRRDAVSETRQYGDPPVVPWLLVVVGSLVIAITMAPTVQSFFFGEVEDTRLSWFVSILAGLMAGGVISWALLGTFAYSASGYHWMGLAAGLCFGGALLLVRLTGSDSGDGLMMALGLAVLECSMVLIMEWVGRGLRQKYASYLEVARANAGTEAYLAAAQEEVAVHQKGMEQAQQEMGIFVEHVRQREHTHAQKDSLVRGAVRAVSDGYSGGVAACAKRVRTGFGSQTGTP